MAEKAAFLGLGTMGRPMAAHLARRGFALAVYTRTEEKARAFAAEFGCGAAATPAEAADGAAFVASCVLDDAALLALTDGPQGAFATLAPGAVYVDHSTVLPETVRGLARAAVARGAAFLDAPVAGAVEKARTGELAAMVGGDAAALETARPFLSAYASAIRHMGPVGHGQLTKMLNQIYQAILIEGLCEGLTFGHRAGLDPDRLIEGLSAGDGTSWWLETRGRAMFGNLEKGLHAKHGRQGLLVKDLALCLSEARRLDIGLPAAALVGQFPGRGQ